MKINYSAYSSISQVFMAAVLALTAVSPCLGWADSAQQLLRGTSDAFSGNLDLQILVDADSVATHLRSKTASETKDFDLNTLSSGLVFLNYSNHDVVILKSSNFDPAHGGTIHMSYLTDGLSGDYGSMDVDLVSSGGIWEIFANDQAGHHVVTQGYFKTHKIFGQIVGIASIDLK